MRTRALIAVPVVLFAGVALVGCSAQSTSSVAPSSSATQVAIPLSADDVMFLQMMIPHHVQALDMADLVEFRSENPDVRNLADQIAAAQDPEITEMRQWLTAAGQPMENAHMAHMMTGMLSPEQTAALTKARGAEFDQLWLEGMRAHHEGAVEMANAVLVTTSNPQVKALAQEVVESQSAEIADIESMLGIEQH